MKSHFNFRYILLISLAGAFGGLLFGYDTAVVAGAIGFLSSRFHLNSEMTGWAASSMLVGCMVGAMVGGTSGDRFGRKACLIACAVLFAISSVLTALPDSLGPFVWARFAAGLAVGAASLLSPLYIAEIAPEKVRGRLVVLYQLAIVIGILAVYLVNLEIQRAGDEAWNVATGWRWMFASLVVPSALFGGFMALAPESPRWLMKMGRRDRAKETLERIGGQENARRELEQIEEALQQEEGRWRELFSPGYRRALVIGTALAVFCQFNGINAIMYYAPEIFKAAGAGTDSAFAQTVLIGLVCFFSTFIALWLVDKAGRKPLLVVGALGQTIALILIGLEIGHTGGSWLLLLSILAFVGFVNISTSPLFWIVASEIFPTKLRARAMSLAVFGVWLSDWVVTQTFPMMRDSFGPAKTFWAYAGCTFLCLIFVLAMVPETKGRTLEEIEASWKGNNARPAR